MKYLVKVTTRFHNGTEHVVYWGKSDEKVSFSDRKRRCTAEQRIARLGFSTYDGAARSYRYTHYNKEYQTVEIVPFTVD